MNNIIQIKFYIKQNIKILHDNLEKLVVKNTINLEWPREKFTKKMKILDILVAFLLQKYVKDTDN